jgi:hypothetical protein
MKFIKFVNEKREVVGCKLLFEFYGELYNVQALSPCALSDSEVIKLKKDLYNAMITYKKELHGKMVSLKKENDFKNLLLQYSNKKDYLTISELNKLLNDINFNLYYMFDLMSVVEVSPTKKGILATENKFNKHYLYNNDYIFYIDGFLN